MMANSIRMGLWKLRTELNKNLLYELNSFANEIISKVFLRMRRGSFMLSTILGFCFCVENLKPTIFENFTILIFKKSYFDRSVF